MCTKCARGFRLVNGACLPSCQFPCLNCAVEDNTLCTSCYGGYSLSNGQCLPSFTCNDDNSCVACPRIAFLFQRRCSNCTFAALPNCDRC